jgi:hypothetical protein
MYIVAMCSNNGRKHAKKYRNENQKTVYHQQKQELVRCSIPEVRHDYNDSIILQKYINMILLTLQSETHDEKLRTGAKNNTFVNLIR